MNDQFVGQTLAGKYRIDSELRQSGSGKTYRGTHLLIDTPVTVKILAPALARDENFVKDFSSEARLVSRISHPNILNVTDFGTDAGGAVYIVAEGASGENLKQTVGREGKFSLPRAVRIASQTASALSAAHRAGVVHHRLSAENILLAQTASGDETVKVLDFGAAQPENKAASSGNTDAESFEYLAPEQNTEAAGDADERSDVYALGVIFYEMLAGEVPFTAENRAALTLKQTENPPPPLASFRRDLPEAVEPVVLKALAKNPEMRFQSATEFVDALNRVSDISESGETLTVQKFADADVAPNNNLWKTAFVVLAGISLLAISMIYATSVKQTEVPTSMLTDVNGQPVQPLNPATGMSEQSLANMSGFQMPAQMENINGVMMMPSSQQQPNFGGGDGLGDGRNYWGGDNPPPGAPPAYVGPGGQQMTVGGGSIFMPDENGQYILVPAPVANANANVQPTPKAGKTPAPPSANVQPSPTPNAQAPVEVKPSPTPKTTNTPAAKPPAPPKSAAPPAPVNKQLLNGAEKEVKN